MKEIHWQHHKIDRKKREKISGHNSFVIWFTGLSGAGKTTLSQTLEIKLHEHKLRTILLDGDNFRHGISSDLGFSSTDRFENLRRAGEVSKLFLDAGTIVLAAFISPVERDRFHIRQLIGEENFIQIFCKCDLAVCEERDVKGLYKKVRDGKIRNFTGIDSIYEIPLATDLIIETDSITVDEAVNVIFEYIKPRIFSK